MKHLSTFDVDMFIRLMLQIFFYEAVSKHLFVPGMFTKLTSM